MDRCTTIQLIYQASERWKTSRNETKWVFFSFLQSRRAAVQRRRRKNERADHPWTASTASTAPFSLISPHKKEFKVPTNGIVRSPLFHVQRDNLPKKKLHSLLHNTHERVSEKQNNIKKNSTDWLVRGWEETTKLSQKSLWATNLNNWMDS